MEYIQSLILGVIQGLTEFLPISSSAHLAFMPEILRIKQGFLDSLSFSVVLHAGTLAGVIIFFWKRIKAIIVSFFKGITDQKERKSGDFRLGTYIIVATIPAVILGITLKDFIEDRFRGCNMCIAVILVLFAVILLVADRMGKRSRGISDITMLDAFMIGCFQAVALFPGVSRSGITITAALFKGYKREDAAEFSFLLSVPAITGAVVFQMKEIISTGFGENAGVLLIGFAAALVSGFFAIKLLLKFVKSNSFLAFVIYRVAVGFLLIGLVIKGVI